MFRLACQLLLILALVVDGLGAAWALHITHADAQAVSQPAPEVPPHAAHHGHADHDAPAAAAAAGDCVTPESKHGCCMESACQCGCILPAVVLRAATAPLASPVTVMPETVLAATLGFVPTSPPFRPPARG